MTPAWTLWQRFAGGPWVLVHTGTEQSCSLKAQEVQSLVLPSPQLPPLGTSLRPTPEDDQRGRRRK